MKLVHINGSETTSKVISEKEYYELWIDPEWKKIDTKSPFEACRLIKTYNNKSKELIVIYKDNRELRTRNTWKEFRVLRAFSDYLKEKSQEIEIVHSSSFSISLDSELYHTEIDGQMRFDEKIGIEIKGQKLGVKQLNFFERKREIIGLEHLHLFAPDFSQTTLERCPETVSLWSYKLDQASLAKYYQNFSLPGFIYEHIGKRHIRFLMQNGKWISPKRRVTSTIKHSSSDKLKREIFSLSHIPVKIYYSLARVIDPIVEFRGRGHPIDNVMLAFDVDAEKHQHILTEKPYCELCISTSLPKVLKVSQMLEDSKLSFKILLSGAKGFHIYILDTKGKARTAKAQEMVYFLNELDGLVDDFRSTYSNEWDYHRIFKLPGTIDASTGQQVTEINRVNLENIDQLKLNVQKNSLNLNDKINPIKINY